MGCLQYDVTHSELRLGLFSSSLIFIIEPHNDRLTATIQEEVPHREAKRTPFPQTTIDAVKVSKAVDCDCPVGCDLLLICWPTLCATNECSDRGRDPGDGANTT